MSNILTSLSDPYNRKARLQPALLSLLPVFVCLALLIRDFQTIWATITGIVTFCGGMTLMTHIGRDRGKALEPTLYKAWDGMPSVAMLRNRDSRLAGPTKERYRTFLTGAVPGLELASSDEEEKCPTLADDGYMSATSWLLAQTRDRGRFGLLFQENINYGFRRNIWALKGPAIVVDVLCLSAVLVLESEFWMATGSAMSSTIDMPAVMCMALIVVHILLFLFIIQRNWVRVSAETYAQQLLAACDVIGSEDDAR